MDLERFPGGDLIAAGLRDLEGGERTAAALLVAIGATRLGAAGIVVPPHQLVLPEHQLYELLAQDGTDDAHSRYNALIRKLVSFERAVECVT